MRILLMFTLQNLSRKFLEKTNPVGLFRGWTAERNRHAFCPLLEPVGAPAINMIFSPFGRLNSAEFLRWKPVLESSALCFFSLQRTNPRSFHKISDKELVKPIVENSWTFWSQLFIFPQRNQLSGCETHRSPILSTYIPPLWHKITGLVCVSQVHLYKAPKEMLGDRPFLNKKPAWEAPREMAHDRWRDQTSVCVKPPKVHQKAREKNWSGRRIKLSRTPDPMVWHLYLQLVGFYGKCRYINIRIHGSYGYGAI